MYDATNPHACAHYSKWTKKQDTTEDEDDDENKRYIVQSLKYAN